MAKAQFIRQINFETQKLLKRIQKQSWSSAVMVETRYPPPTRNIAPQWHDLKAGTIIQRIFDPT